MSRRELSEDALRWKTKFLDALEEQEQREQALSSRIKLLRRGLLGVSLAGDGLDASLDRELGQLRRALRRDDSESGLELLLEQIEKSVLRLDNRKEHSASALRQALSLSLDQLEEIDFSRALRRQLRQFSRALRKRVSDTTQHGDIIADFLQLLRSAVTELSAPAAETMPARQGLWRRLFQRQRIPLPSAIPLLADAGTDPATADDTPVYEVPEGVQQCPGRKVTDLELSSAGAAATQKSSDSADRQDPATPQTVAQLSGVAEEHAGAAEEEPMRPGAASTLFAEAAVDAPLAAQPPFTEADDADRTAVFVPTRNCAAASAQPGALSSAFNDEQRCALEPSIHQTQDHQPQDHKTQDHQTQDEPPVSPWFQTPHLRQSSKSDPSAAVLTEPTVFALDGCAAQQESDAADPALTAAAQDKPLELDTADALQGELIRDRSGLQEPGFSYIGGHVEPLLLRILENVYIAEQSHLLAGDLRRRVARGLNWYDFVAVLEDLVSLIGSAFSQERDEFQDFLAQVTAGLAQVQSFMASSQQHQREAEAGDTALDAAMREQIREIDSSIQGAEDLSELKKLVHSQLDTILGSLDNFKESRRQSTLDMASEMRRMADRVAAMEMESQELKRHLQQQQANALRDSLTGLPNREAYDRTMRRLWQQWQQEADAGRSDERELCLVVADVDHFKTINDSYGHLAGDKVLKVLARELENGVRNADYVARYGGEEFVIIMPGTRRGDLISVTEKLRRGIEVIPFHFKQQQVQITMSFGLTLCRTGDSVESLFDRADKALYHAKQAGRNRCQLAEA